MRRMCKKISNSSWVFGHKFFFPSINQLHTGNVAPPFTLCPVGWWRWKESLCHRQLKNRRWHTGIQLVAFSLRWRVPLGCFQSPCSYGGCKWPRKGHSWTLHLGLHIYLFNFQTPGDLLTPCRAYPSLSGMLNAVDSKWCAREQRQAARQAPSPGTPPSVRVSLIIIHLPGHARLKYPITKVNFVP